MTQMLNVTHQTPAFGPVPRSRIRPLVRRSLIVTLAAGALVSSAYAPASADSVLAQTTAIVEVGSTITLTGLPESFTLSGLPGDDIVTQVGYTVETNNVSGYSVTAAAEDSVLTPAGTSGETIPIDTLKVEDAAGTSTSMSQGGVLIATKASRSESGGDPQTNNFSMTIPFVASDTYSVVLNYIATESV